MSPLKPRLDSLNGESHQLRRAKVATLMPMALCLAALMPEARPYIGNALLGPLEARFERTKLDDTQSVAGFIALGGGDERIVEAARLTRAHPGAKLVITGHGEKAVQLANASGLPPDRILIEPAAQNTFENAQFTAPLLGDQANARWVLVTSASHMPRAVGCFRKANIAIEAWPIDDVIDDWRDKLSIALHEWLGMLAYRLQGRTDALFPAPLEHPVEQASGAAREQANALTRAFKPASVHSLQTRPGFARVVQLYRDAGPDDVELRINIDGLSKGSRRIAHGKSFVVEINMQVFKAKDDVWDHQIFSAAADVPP